MSNLPATKNRRVLVIDDNRAIHDDFRKILCPATATSAALDVTEAALFGLPLDAVPETQFEVDSAYQGQEGVALVEKKLAEGLPYAMAFVDVRMPPGWDGVETTRKIWELDPNLQIVLCTAYSDYSWGEMFEKLGRRDGLLILKKPFDGVEAFQLAHALTEKWMLHQESQRKMEELENRVAQRTSELLWKTAFLEAQANSSIDGVVVVDQQGKKTFQNQRIVELFKIPKAIADEGDDAISGWVRDMAKNPGEFAEKVAHLYAHPNELSRDEIELKDGKILDRYSSPVVGKDGENYGRIWTFRDITESKRASALLMESQQRLALATESAHIGIWDWDVVTNKLVWDTQMYELYGIREQDFSGAYNAWQKGLHPEDREQAEADITAAVHSANGFHVEFRVVWPDGEVRHIEAHALVQRADDGSTAHMIGVNWDITERKRLEGQLVQSQKMETVGKLAGGIAHEFNSILTAIMGQSELLLADLPSESPMAKNATEINKAAGRAATLTRQLLAYGRKQLLQPEVIDLNQIVTSMEGMFHHLMGGEVDTHIMTAPNLKTVKADAGQIEQVIMNMAINAREAMPRGGKLMLETANVSFDEESVVRYPELRPGDYAMLAITDTGTGMSEKVKARLFEPFFSTKGVGQGTGLGLSTCYGIIKQSGGHISVYSEPARGSCFKIYLPQVEKEAKMSMPRLESPDLPRGTETILLAEDDPALCEMAATLLRRLGYTVFTAANGIEALNLKQRRDVGYIDLLFTDVVMPHMSGKELADRVQALFPHTKILFASAYTESSILHHGVLDKGVALLQKPFTPSALARKVREVLDATGIPSEPGLTANVPAVLEPSNSESGAF